MDSRQKLFDKAHAILDKLESACLPDGDIRMHDSIIDMALNIRSDELPCMSRFGICLKEILDEELWFEDLDKFSFVIDGREESSNRSSISKISILLSRRVSYLEKIPDLLLRLLPGLRILDLSDSRIKEIPHSVSDLISLTALVLRYCRKLVQISYIGKLTSLQKLDLYYCSSLIDIPDGLEYLVRLKYLNLYETGIENFPRSILGNLRNLQYLGINHLKVEELVGLNKLESLCCWFSTLEELSLLLTHVELNEYNIHVGRPGRREYQEVGDYPRAVSICKCIGEEEQSLGDYISLPTNILGLVVGSWSNEIILLSGWVPQNLEALEIRNCRNFGVIFGDQNEGFVLSNPDASPFHNLKKLYVALCSKLKYIFGPGLEKKCSIPNVQEIRISHCEDFEGIVAASSAILGDFPNLEKILILDCGNMRSLLEVPEMLICLKNLRSIDIDECENFEGIIASSSAILGGFPNLENISISYCGNMRSLLVVPEMLTCLQNISSISMFGCNIKTLVSIEAFLQLQGLKELDIYECPDLETIIEPASPAMLPTASATRM